MLVRGLKRLISGASGWDSDEEKRFIRYFEMVQDAAKAKNCIFFFDDVDGHSAEFSNPIDYEDITGWLIPVDMADAFEQEWRVGEPSARWDDFFFDADWAETEAGVVISLTKIE